MVLGVVSQAKDHHHLLFLLALGVWTDVNKDLSSQYAEFCVYCWKESTKMPVGPMTGIFFKQLL